MKKSISIIGGADGPTSIFVAKRGQKDKNIIHRFRNWKFYRKRNRVKKQIRPGAHSIQETILYIIRHYNASEVDSSSPDYIDRIRQLKYSLILQEQPELVHDENDQSPACPVNLEDTNVVSQWMAELEEWHKKCRERMNLLPQNAISMKYHMYHIDCGADGQLEIEVEEIREILGISFSGDMKKLHKIQKEMYLYFGVTQKDIDFNTNRYHMLISVLLT